MHIKHISIKNILGIEELDIKPGRITEIQGKNGSGKTSVIEAIKYALGGGTDATLIRNGAEEGEIVLLLDDGTRVRKRVTGKNDGADVYLPDVGKISASQTYLNKLHDILGQNPIELITADPKDRGKYVLEVAPMETPMDELRGIADGLVDELPGGIEEMHALMAIAKVHSSIYEKRTSVNTVAKSKRTTANELAGSLPDEEMNADELRERKNNLSEERDALIQEGVDEAEKIDVALKGRRKTIEQERDARLQEIRDEYEAKLDEADEKAEAEKQKKRDEIGPKTSDLKAEIAAIDERIERASENANTREVIAKMKLEAEENESKSEKMTEALERLDVLKTEIADDLPLRLEIREDGEIYRDGLPFSRLNRAQQVDIAMRLSMTRVGDLRFVCLDGLNDLDEDTYAEIDKWSEENDVQVLGTRVVTGKDLTVDPREAVPA